jgi:UDP-glucose 4-epimerase
MNRETIIVTGGCGFIGSNLIRYLEAHRRPTPRLLVFDDLSTGKRADIEGTGAALIEGNVRDEAALGRAFAGVDHVIHLAAHTRVVESVERPRENFIDNVVGTFNVLEAARAVSVRSVTIASTGGAIIGAAEPPVHELLIPKPVSPYGASKLCGEAYCSAFAGAYGLRTTALRFSNVYGPRSYQKGSVIATFFRALLDGKELSIYGDGEQTRDFIHVDDICAGIAAALDREGPTYDYFHLGSGVETSINSLVTLIERITGRPFRVTRLPARAGEINRNFASIGKARSLLRFVPAVDLESGLATTWEWFTAHR